MKRRFAGAVLTGLGALSLVLAVGLPLYVAPAAARLPNDLQGCPAADQPQPSGCVTPSVAEAKDATFLQIKDGKLAIQQGTLRSTIEVFPRADVTARWQAAGKLGDDAMVWDVYQTVIWVETDEVISAYSTELAVDRASAAAADWDGQWLDDANLGEARTSRRNVTYQGQTYKFPFGTEKSDYQIFDRDLRQALPARFQDVTTVGGVETYHFEQAIGEREIAVAPSSLAALLSTFAPDATSGAVRYSNLREVWVDPVTGAYIDVRERQRKVLVPDVGDETTLLEANFRYTSSTVEDRSATATDTARQLGLVRFYGPIVFGALAILAILVGLLLLARRGKARFDAGPWEAAR